MYWFAFPAIPPPSGSIAASPPASLTDAVQIAGVPAASIASPVGAARGGDAVAAAIQAYVTSADTRDADRGFFCVRLEPEGGGESATTHQPTVTPLSAVAASSAAPAAAGGLAFGFVDPGTSLEHPGWPLRYERRWW